MEENINLVKNENENFLPNRCNEKFALENNSLFQNINSINDKIQELFWHQVNENKNLPIRKKIHFFTFIFIIYFLLFPLSKLINKFINNSKKLKDNG